MSETNDPRPFWTIERIEGESIRDFVLRTWGECYPDLGADELQNRMDEGSNSAVVVKNGYLSPYKFGRVLREMVGDEKAAILGAYAKDRATIYYTWRIEGDGPVVAALYNPDLRPETLYSAMDTAGEIDFFDAVDTLGA